MENQIVCPQCKKTLPVSDLLSDAAKGEGSFMKHIKCECGERITYWQVTAQLREQKTISGRLRNWVRSLSHTGG